MGKRARALQRRIFPAKYLLAANARNCRKTEGYMAWTTPILVEICAGLEINGYLPPEI